MTQPKTVRGRPVDLDEQQRRKDQLLDATNELLKKHSYRSITIRQVAAAAGMKSAMISYYFGSKEGLFIAVITRMAQQQSLALKNLPEQDDPLRAFVHGMLANMSQNAHVAKIIHDEFLSQEGALREQFMDLLPKRIALLLTNLIERLQAEGKIKPESNPKWLAFSLMSMIISPFIAEPVRKGVWKIEDDTLASEAWADHIYHLFYAGAGVQQS